MKLQDKVAIVNGACGGIGLEIASKLAAGGASLVINDLDATVAEKTVASIEAAGTVQLLCIPETNYASDQTPPCSNGLSSQEGQQQ